MFKKATSIILFFLLTMPAAFGLTMQNKTHFVCITDNNKPPVYIEPPQTETHTNLSSFFYDYNLWKTDNWTQVISMNNVQGPILDKRWEGFGVTYAHYLRFTFVSSLALSAYKPGRIEFFIDDDEDLDHFIITPNSTIWFHFLVVLKDSNTYVFRNDFTENNNFDNYTLVKSVHDFHPIQFVIKSPEDTYWKLHNYTYMTANVVTKTPINLSLRSQDTPCLMLYYQLCPHCCLEVLIAGNRTLLCYEIDEESQDILQRWKSLKILIDTPKIISFLRSTNNGNFSGFWNIDIQSCSPERYLYYTTVDGKGGIPRACNHLNEKDVGIPQLREVSYGHICNPGLLGSNCDISCETLLGIEKKDCQGYKICENEGCYCASGLQGEFCEELSVAKLGQQKVSNNSLQSGDKNVATSTKLAGDFGTSMSVLTLVMVLSARVLYNILILYSTQ